jgi:hypothetical protein
VSLPAYDLSSVPQAAKIKAVMPPNLSTQAYLAAESQLKYKHKLFSVGAKYKRIEPDYKSMGAYYFQTDVEQYTGNFSTRLFKGKLNLNTSAGVQKDNVAKKKLATTARNIFSMAANYQANQHFGIDLNYSNYGTAQKAGTRNLSDTAKINQINNSITLSPHYAFQKNNLNHTIFLVLGNQSLNDRNKFTSSHTQVNMQFANLMYSLINNASNTNYSAGINYNSSATEAGTIVLEGVSAGVGKSLLKENKMNVDFNTSVNSSQYNGVGNGLTVNLTSSCGYVISKQHRLKANVVWLLNNSKNEAAGKSFNELTMMVQYNFSF